MVNRSFWTFPLSDSQRDELLVLWTARHADLLLESESVGEVEYVQPIQHREMLKTAQCSSSSRISYANLVGNDYGDEWSNDELEVGSSAVFSNSDSTYQFQLSFNGVSIDNTVGDDSIGDKETTETTNWRQLVTTRWRRRRQQHLEGEK